MGKNQKSILVEFKDLFIFLFLLGLLAGSTWYDEEHPSKQACEKAGFIAK